MEIIAFLVVLSQFPTYLLAVVLKIWALSEILYKWNFPLSLVPGPPLASWTRLWWISVVSRSQVDLDMLRLFRDYGNVVRIAPNSIIISDPDVSRDVLAVGSKFKRGPWFDSLRLNPCASNVVSQRNPAIHREMRAMLAPGLSGNDIDDAESIVDEHMLQYLETIEEQLRLSNGNSVSLDLSTAVPLLTLDIIAHLCIGKSIGTRNSIDELGFFQALNTGMFLQQYLAVLNEIPTLLLRLGKIHWLRGLIYPQRSRSNGIGRMMLIIQEAVERRHVAQANGMLKRDMLESFLSRGLSAEQASSEVLIVMTSGVGATSYAVQAIIKSIVGDPIVKQKLQEEVDNIVAVNLKSIRDRVPNSILRNMPYLQACIMEGLRKYPPVFSQLRERVVPPQGAVLSGYAIPGGTYVGFNSIGNQLNQIYGDHVEEYHPERWLIDDKMRLKQMRRNLELVYGHGNSKCLGMNIANLELNKIVFGMFRRYDISFCNTDRPWKTRGDFVLKEFRVRLQHRDGGKHCSQSG